MAESNSKSDCHARVTHTAFIVNTSLQSLVTDPCQRPAQYRYPRCSKNYQVNGFKLLEPCGHATSCTMNNKHARTPARQARAYICKCTECLHNKHKCTRTPLCGTHAHANNTPAHTWAHTCMHDITHGSRRTRRGRPSSRRAVSEAVQALPAADHHCRLICPGTAWTNHVVCVVQPCVNVNNLWAHVCAVCCLLCVWRVSTSCGCACAFVLVVNTPSSYVCSCLSCGRTCVLVVHVHSWLHAPRSLQLEPFT